MVTVCLIAVMVASSCVADAPGSGVVAIVLLIPADVPVDAHDAEAVLSESGTGHRRPSSQICLSRTSSSDWVRTERTGIPTLTVPRWAAQAHITNPLASKWFGSPSNAWARRIYLPQGRMLELGSHGATGPVFGGSACRYLRRAGTGPGLQRLSFPLKRELIGQEASTG